jgi:hypothetical protein
VLGSHLYSIYVVTVFKGRKFLFSDIILDIHCNIYFCAESHLKINDEGLEALDLKFEES